MLRSGCRLVLALVLVACGGGGSAPPPPPVPGSGGTTGSGGSAPGPGTGGSETPPPAVDAALAADAPAPVADAAASNDAAAPSSDAAVVVPEGSAPVLEDPLPPCLQTVAVANSAALAPALTAARPGDCLVLADGDYTFPVVKVTGTPAAPIVVRAANRGMARVPTGGIEITGSTHLALEGLLFTSGGSIRFTDSPFTRLSRTRIQPTADKGGAWVNIVGQTHHVRLDRNDMGPKTALGNMVQTGVLTPGQVVQYIRIDHNHFHDVHYGGGNGWETIRAGYSHVAPSKGFITIEYNLFTKADGDPETVSVKSSDAIVRYNTIRDTNGQICLRHGNRTQVYGNFLLNSGGGNGGSGGNIRIYGADHKIFNNYIAGTGGITLGAGSNAATDQAGTEHYRVYRAQLVNNTIVGGGVLIGGGQAPMDCTIANNLIQGGAVGGGGDGTKAMNNVTNGAGMMMVDGMWRLVAGSPAIDASIAGFDYVTEDIDGQPRAGKADLGADELSTDPVLRKALTPADVGVDVP
jgi:hypothetical protein